MVVREIETRPKLRVGAELRDPAHGNSKGVTK